jgi:PAS domain S-box-containing protein
VTIKKKIFTAGAGIFILFLVLAAMNIWTHQKILTNLKIRDEVNEKLDRIEKFASRKNELIRLISDIVASGHVPPFTNEQINLPLDAPAGEGTALMASGKLLVFLIGEKERASHEVESTFSDYRARINDLYYQLDKEIATVLAVSQLDQVLGQDATEKSTLAPYVLKSLNQLTLVALNSLIERNYTQENKGIVERNKHFLSSQLHTIDPSGHISAHFEELFNLMESLEAFIAKSNKKLDAYNSDIEEAKHAFNKAVRDTETETIVAKAREEVKNANLILEQASRRNLIIVIVFLFAVPLVVIIVGFIGLNRIIVGPITHLVEAMKDVESGSFDATAMVKTHDEIGELARAFNAMAAEIKTKVTELSRLNQILTDSESKYRTLVDNIPQRVFLKNKDLVYVSCNLNYASDLGIHEEEIVGKTDFDFFPKELAEKYRNDDARIISTEISEEVEEAYIQAGKEIIVLTNKTPIWNEQGNVIGILGIFWDITERKRAEEELQLSRFSLDNASVETFWVNSEGLIQYANERATKNLGYSRDELVGMPIWDIDPEFTKERYDQYWREMSDGEPVLLESFHHRKDGSAYPAEIFVRQGEFKGTRLNFAFINDISYRKRAEEEKQKLQLQLHQSRKMEAIGTLAGGIAHDFNNLLQAINGYTQMMLLDKQEDDRDYPNLKAIHDAGVRAAQLVSQLLLFSRKVETEKKPVELNQTVEQIRRILERTIPKMIDIELHLGGRLWNVNVDPVQIEQILLNLGTNAADAMPDGGKLVIETENIVLDKEKSHVPLGIKDGNYVLLSVSDSGHGMDQETVEHIFEPFYTTKEIGQGTGLGLASVYGIVKSHDGHITCYSEVGMGTTFKIYLPAVESLDTDGYKDMDRLPPLPQGGTETLLVVDDEEPILDFALQVLAKFGYTVLTASSGEEALDVYSGKRDEIDLVITDIGMPGMGGHRCLQELIRINPDVKVIIASGYSINGQIKKSLDQGAAGYVGKPYKLSDLLDTIRAVLDG